MADEKAGSPEVAKNCPSCKKVLKKKKRYYREGAYYCNKNCYKKRPAAAGAAEPAPAAA